MQFLHRFGPRAAAALAIVLGSLVLAANVRQDGVAPAPEESPPSADNGNLSISVVVTDQMGHPVSGLQKADFTLLDNKTPAPILGFRALSAKDHGGDPVHVVIVVDMINTRFTEVAWEREQLTQFLKEDNGILANPTTLSVFSDRGVALDQQYTVNGNELLAEFDKTQTNLRIVNRSSGFWGEAEMLQMSLAQLSQLAAYENTQPGQKMVLVLSPGWPLLAWAGGQEGNKAQQWVFNSIVELTNGFRQAKTTLYCLDPYELGRTDPFYYQSYLKPVTDPNKAQYPDLSLQVLAEHTGGEVLIGGHDITGKLNTAVRDAAASYVLTFQGAPGDRANEYHALQVKVDQPRVQVRTTAGYYARAQAGLPAPKR